MSITAPSQRLVEAKESTNDAVLELLMKRADGEDVADATLEEARVSRSAVDYLAGVITEFGPGHQVRATADRRRGGPLREECVDPATL